MTATDPRALLYGDSLSPDDARRISADILTRCDDGELYLQHAASESFVYDDGRLKSADYSRDAGFGLRGVSGEMTGFAHANEISEKAIRRAGETLQLLDPAKGEKAAPPRRSNRHLYTDASPLDLVSFEEKVALLQRIDMIARAKDPRVSQVTAGFSGSWSVVEVVRPDGFTATDIRPLVRLNVSIVAEANGRRLPASLALTDSNVSPPRVSPYKLSLSQATGGLVLAGYAPSEEKRTALLDAAHSQFGSTQIKDDVQFASGAPDERASPGS